MAIFRCRKYFLYEQDQSFGLIDNANKVSFLQRYAETKSSGIKNDC